MLFLVRAPIEILKGDLPVFADGVMDIVNAVVYALVHGFDPVGDKDLTLKLGGLMNGGKRLKLFNQLVAFLVRDEFGRLYGVNKKLQLRKLKGAVGDEIYRSAVFLAAFDVNAEKSECFKVILNTFSFGCYAFF